MSDSSFTEVEPSRPTPRSNTFETECFDADIVRTRYGIDPDKHCWAEVSTGENLYNQLLAYLGRHGEQARSFAPKVGVQELTDVEEMLGEHAPAKTVRLHCGLGLFKLKHTLPDGQTLSIKALHQRRGPIVGGRCGPATWENLVIFAEGSDNSNVLQAFLESVVNSESPDCPNNYSIYRWQVEHEYWRHSCTKKSRHIDSVVLPDLIKDKIVGDLDSFLSRESFQFYTNHGIPYKRSYLFYGVPGAGKTSLLTAIAGKYRRNLCIMQPTDPRFTDDSLAEAIKEAPSRSIIVLEDIDALFDKNRDTKNTKMNISFSGLLNALDGVSNPDGQIFVLTTNFRENLDSALIRNGRVDLHVEFTHASGEQMEKLFLQFYPAPADADLAVAFRQAVDRVLDGKPINMAALQHFFIRNMRTPARDAVAAVDARVEDLTEKDAAAAAAAEAEKEGKDQVEETKDKKDEEEEGRAVPAASGKQEFTPASSSNIVHVHVYNTPQPSNV
jgi:chaperone BCS1